MPRLIWPQTPFPQAAWSPSHAGSCVQRAAMRALKQEGGSEAPTRETAGKGGCEATAMGARTPGEGEGAVRGGL